MIKELRWHTKSLLDRIFFDRNMQRLSRYAAVSLLLDRERTPAEIWDQMNNFSRFPSPDTWESIPMLKKRARGAIWTYCGAMQDRFEWCTFLDLVRQIRPKNTIEIGTADGGSLFGLAHYTQEKLISIDLPQGVHGGGYTDAKRGFYKAFELLQPNLDIHLIQQSSLDPRTLHQVTDILAGDQVDALFIDGGHFYENVLLDFKTYLPLVRDSGIVAFHDISAHTWLEECGVGRLWEQISVAFPDNCMPIIVDTRLGIGVLKITPQVKKWAENLNPRTDPTTC